MADDLIAALNRFVREKWFDCGCSRCGGEKWGAGVRLTAPVWIIDQPQAPGSSASFIPLYCENCGYTTMVFAPVFDAWQATN